jgi:peptidylprolyl isomerase
VRRLLIFLALFPVLALAACGGDEEKVAAPAPAETPAQTPAATATLEPGSGSGEVPANVSALAEKVPKNVKQKPSIPKPEGDPPAELVTVDVVEGKGAAAKAGDEVTVQYAGWSWSTGEQFDASWDRGAEPFAFPLGSGSVIPGWDEGVAGMKEGGRRLLVIPPDKGYGQAGAPPAIGPNETLIFVVDLVKIGA